MALEIERKFLVENDAWRSAVESSKSIVQAYVAIDGDTSMRVRIYDETRAELTVKIGVSAMTRHEFEYVIPGRPLHLDCSAQVLRVEPQGGQRGIAARIDDYRDLENEDNGIWELFPGSGSLQ